MPEPLNATTIEQLAKQFKEPAWLTELRRSALDKHTKLPWPHPSDDVWRRTDVALLDPNRDFVSVPPSLLQRMPISEAFAKPLGHEQLLIRANGSWVTSATTQGFDVRELADVARHNPDVVRHLLEADGLSEAEQKLTSLNAAFHHDDLFITVPTNASPSQPLRLVHLFSVAAKQAIFPMTIMTIGAGSSVTLIDEYVSTEDLGSDEPHLVNGRIELIIEPHASVHYVRLQRWGAHAREFLLQRAVLGTGATLTMANINLGAALSKAHVITRLIGEHASTKLYGFVFGHDKQHIDQHTLQDHDAPHTTSDLQLKAALQDESRMIYTGLIRIAKQAKQTNAYQANHNLLLNEGARAETIPMLEILADDVQCKHGASIGPIDDEQTFYLMSRGIPREQAQRLLVMGFVESIIQQIPFAPLQERLRQEIEGGLHS